MAASCCSTAAFSISRPHLRYVVVSPNSVSQTLKSNRFDVSFRARRRLEVRKSLRVSCLANNRNAPEVVTGKSWDKLIKDSDIPVLVEFYANWCGPCRMVHRVIDEIAAEYSGRLKCFILDVDMDSQIAENFEIKAVPVVFLFKNGEKRDSVVGTMPKEFFVAAIERVLSS